MVCLFIEFFTSNALGISLFTQNHAGAEEEEDEEEEGKEKQREQIQEWRTNARSG